MSSLLKCLRPGKILLEAHCILTLLLQATHLPAEPMRIVLERCYNDLRLLSMPSKTLKAEGFFRSNKACLYLLIESCMQAGGRAGTSWVKPNIDCKLGCSILSLSAWSPNFHRLPSSRASFYASMLLLFPLPRSTFSCFPHDLLVKLWFDPPF